MVLIIDDRIKLEKESEVVESKSKKHKGLYKNEYKKQIEQITEKQEMAQKELDEVIYDVLNLTTRERRQVEKGLSELQEIRRLRTKT